MKINKLKINSFGKLKDKEINFNQNLNIIYGKNEAGKSTIIKFIINSIYGASKNKKGKDYSDFEKYIPWVGEEFSGKLEYKLDNNNKFEIYREFKKKNPKIFNEKMEDISKQFNIDKNRGNEFFYEQTKVDEDLFLSTLVTNQQEVKLEKNEQNILIQKIANLVGTGEDNVSYKKAIDRINRRQLDEIGTQRSREKPINIIDRNIEQYESEKEELEKYKDTKYEIEENEKKLFKDVFELENEKKYIYELKKIKEKENIDEEKIKIKENIKKENIEKINSINNKIKEINKEKENNKINNKKIKNKKIKNKKSNIRIILILFFTILINIIQFILIKNKLINYILFLTVPVAIIYLIIKIKNENNKIKIEKNNKKILEEKINTETNNLNTEKRLLENNNNNIEKEINKIKIENNLKNNLEKEKLKNIYLNKINLNINNITTLEKINYELEKNLNNLNNKKIQLHTLDLDKKNIESKLDNLSKIEERLVNYKQQKVNLNHLEKSMELAKSILNESYEEMRNTVTPKFTQNLSRNISAITDGKYDNVMFNDETGLFIELSNGDYVPVNKLSVGTIEQLYLSLRLSMVKELSDETMPILLDEAFAYYDNERLSNLLKFLSEKFKDNQIIIFTCTNRERDILNKLNISYNFVEL